jgi:hypothetical protein
MRELAQVLVHVHDADIEISEGPEPPLVPELTRSAGIKLNNGL